MHSQATFLNCPEFLDSDGAARCGLPAEAARYIINSTGGPLESARITCPRGHHFNGPVEYLTVPEPPAPQPASAPPILRPVAQTWADTADPLAD